MFRHRICIDISDGYLQGKSSLKPFLKQYETPGLKVWVGSS